nr:14113_t:CDS:2 [Entrophospora candida]CAG8484962.1 6675_t:CDS:2 [Entrophospora candida]
MDANVRVRLIPYKKTEGLLSNNKNKSLGANNLETYNSLNNNISNLSNNNNHAIDVYDDDRAGRVENKSFFRSIMLTIQYSSLNFLLIFLPLGFLAKSFDLSDTYIFTFNFLAIIPLSKLLGFATEDISLRVGQTLGGLLNATFGNAVELIISLVALMKGEIRVVQSSMLGSIISNLLLVLGMCFVAGGFYHDEQEFNQTAAQTSSSLMALACAGLIIPAAFNFAIGSVTDNATNVAFLQEETINLSRGASIVLLIIYVLYLYFQLKTHSRFYLETEDEIEEPEFSLCYSLFLLAFITLLISFSADLLVGSIEGIVEVSGLSKTFVGLILLPIVGNAAEHVTAVTVAMKNKMSLAIGVAVGSSMQIALFITPFLVIVGWIIDENMTLFFHTFETVVLFISVLMTNYLIQDGKSNWLEGAMLLATYTIIALAFFFYPDNPDID